MYEYSEHSSARNKNIKVMASGTSTRSCGSFLVQTSKDRQELVIFHSALPFNACRTEPGRVKRDVSEALLDAGWTEVDVALFGDLRLLARMYDDSKLFRH